MAESIPNYEPVDFQQNQYSARFFTDMGTARRVREEVGPQTIDGGFRRRRKTRKRRQRHRRRQTRKRR